MVTNSSKQVVARHDYLPFGEEIAANLAGRLPGLGYGGTDDTTRKFTSKERDSESGLDYFGARYYSGAEVQEMAMAGARRGRRQGMGPTSDLPVDHDGKDRDRRRGLAIAGGRNSNDETEQPGQHYRIVILADFVM